MILFKYFDIKGIVNRLSQVWKI